MAVDYFLKIDGIEGESTNSSHKGEIEVESFSWGVSNPTSAIGGSGAGAGKAQFSGFNFMDAMSKASPQLFIKCVSGYHIKDAVLTAARMSGDTTVEFMKLTISDVLVSSYQTSGSSEVPQDSVSLNFAKIEFEYSPQDAKGTVGSPVIGSWDLTTNKAV